MLLNFNLYIFSRADIASGQDRQLIYGAIKEWTEKVPCLRFVEMQTINRRGYVHFHVGVG